MNDKSSKQKRARNQADAQFARPAQTDKDSAMAEYKARRRRSAKDFPTGRGFTVARSGVPGPAGRHARRAARASVR